jgi:Flp pilus assembly protein TadG
VCAERGSALMLMPAGVLVLIILGAIAVDFTVVFLAQRELANAAAAAANDAATAALSESAFYGAGQLELDPTRAREEVVASFGRRAANVVEGQVTSVQVDDVDGQAVQVTVRAQASVDLIFSPAIPGAPARRTVREWARATAVRP